jgi:hypothetical protein
MFRATEAGTGWSRTFLNSGLSPGLIAWGICAITLGGFQFALGVPRHWFGLPRTARRSAAAPTESVNIRWRGWWRCSGARANAELNGALSAPVVMAKAAAPLALAGLWSATGQPRLVFAAALVLMVAGVAGLALISRRPSEPQPLGVSARSIS